MKKTAVLLAVALLLAGCAPAGVPQSSSGTVQSSTEVASAAGTEDVLLRAMEQGIAEAPPNGMQIDTGATIGYSSFRAVRVTPAFLTQIAALFAEHPAEKTSQMKSISSETSDMQSIMLQGETADGKTLVVELFSVGSVEYPDKAVLWLQLGDEMNHYIYEKGVFEQLKELINANLYEHVITIEGNYMELPPVGEEKENWRLQQVLQFDDTLLCHYVTTEGAVLLQAVNPNSGTEQYTIQPAGEAAGVDELFGPANSGYHYRVYTQTGYTDYNAKNTAAPRQRELPAAVLAQLREHSRNSFNEYNGQLVYVGQDGIYTCAADGTAPRRLLAHEELAAATKEGMPEEFGPYYGEPRLLNDGKQLVALMINPGGQSGYMGLVVLDMATGEVTSFTDVFDAMSAGVVYLDDNTVVARKMKGGTLIDLATMQTTNVTTAPQSANRKGYDTTHDYKTIAVQATQAGTDGIAQHTLYTFAVGKEEEKTTLLTATGNYLNLQAMTQDYLICTYEDAQKSGCIAVRHRME